MKSSAGAEHGSKDDEMILGDCLRERIFICFLPVSCSLWDLCSPSRDRTWTTAVKAPNPNLWTAREFLNNIFFLRNYLFNWSIITFQCCAGFCYTTKWTSYVYTYIPSLIPSPWGHHTEVRSRVLYSSFPLSIFFFFLISKRSLFGSQTTDSSENWQDQWTFHLGIYNIA